MPDQPVLLKESEILQIIDKNRALDATYKLLEIILQSTEFEDMTKKIADTIPRAMGYELGMLVIANYPKQKMECISVSETLLQDDLISEKISQTLRSWSVVFGYEDNLTVRSLNANEVFITPDLHEVLKPTLSQDQCKDIQNKLGVNSFIVAPLEAKEEIIGVLIVGSSETQEQLSNFEKDMIDKFSESAGIALENSKLYSNLKKAKDELHKAYENLKVINKMKDEFLTVASHELRTPMTIVKSYLWMLEKQKAGKLSKKQQEYLSKASTGTQRMIELINDMLDISKFEQDKVSFKLTQIDLSDVIKEIVDNFEIKIKEKNIKITFNPKDYKDILIDADEDKLKEIITNLIGNAVKFTEEGYIEITIRENNEEVEVTIRDTGSGIQKEDLGRLFHKFGRIDNSYTIATETGGTGLGLYIVKLYVEGMGGRVCADSEGLGKGSTFCFTLPKNKIKKYKDPLDQTQVPTQNITTIS